jgi:hypothetical protein
MFCLQGSLEFQKSRVLLNLQHLLCIRRAGCEGGRPSFFGLQGEPQRLEASFSYVMTALWSEVKKQENKHVWLTPL